MENTILLVKGILLPPVQAHTREDSLIDLSPAEYDESRQYANTGLTAGVSTGSLLDR